MSNGCDEEKNGVGRPRKYLTIEEFNEFRFNAFRHLENKMSKVELRLKYMLMLGVAILAGIIGGYFIG